MISKQDLHGHLTIAKANIKVLWKKHRTRILRAGGWSAIALLLVISFTIIGVGVGLFGPLPKKNDLAKIQNSVSSLIYSHDGKVIGKYYYQNRTNTSFDEISPDVINALIVAEDKRFLKHKGVDFRGWARVFFKTILLQDRGSGGGSTISQQLAKNIFNRKKYWTASTIINKIREVYIACRLEKVYTKNEILALYLNTVPFGDNIFGINVVSQQIFGKSPSDLEAQEAATIIGMLKANATYHPHHNPSKSKSRRNLVLDLMGNGGFFSQTEVDSLSELPLATSYKVESHHSGTAAYFREHLRPVLTKNIQKYNSNNGTNYNLYTDGLKIFTTIDSELQKKAEQAVNKHVAYLQKLFDRHWKNKSFISTKVYNIEKAKSKRYKNLKSSGFSELVIDSIFDLPVEMKILSLSGEKIVDLSPKDSIKHYLSFLHAGFLALDNQTREIRAWVGGINHYYFQYDHVLSKRQAGSTFKPFVYGTALKAGYHPCDYFDNELITYEEFDNWAPENSNGEYGGSYSMSGAMSKSVNTVSVQLLMEVGIDQVIQTAKSLGIKSKVPKVPSIALGTAEVTLLEMVNSYSTIANLGRHEDPGFLVKIEAPDGTIIYQRPKSIPTQVFDPTHAEVLIKMMQKVITEGTASSLKSIYKIPGDIAGKTGTTQSHADGWFVGFTPKYTAGVWVGGSFPEARFRSIDLGQGAHLALPIWGTFFQSLYKSPRFRKFRLDEFTSTYPDYVFEMDCEPFIEQSEDVWDDFLEELLSEKKGKTRSSRRKDRNNDNTAVGDLLRKIFSKKQ